MAVILYKDGKPEIFNEHSYLHMLDAGYSYSKDAPEDTQEIEDLADEVETEDVLLDVEPVDLSYMPEDELRAYAKDMGIRSWHNKGIDKLIKEITPED